MVGHVEFSHNLSNYLPLTYLSIADHFIFNGIPCCIIQFIESHETHHSFKLALLSTQSRCSLQPVID